jgi:membrane protease YdiL (CAAX protease family)
MHKVTSNLPGATLPQAGTQKKALELAPAWHTATLIALIIAVAATGTLLSRRGLAVQVTAAPASLLTLYLQMILVAWGLLFYVCRFGRRRNALPALVGQKWQSLDQVGTDLALAALAWLLLKLCEWMWMRLLPASSSAAVAVLLPHTGAERLVWVVVSVSVGLAEEVIYRGYLQTQLAAFTGRTEVAMVLQAALFGLAHADQGTSAMMRMALYGLGFGALARFRRSLLPGILCHVWTDLASGLGSFV